MSVQRQLASSVEDLVTQTLEFTIEEVDADRNVSNAKIADRKSLRRTFDIKDAINQVDHLNIQTHRSSLHPPVQER